MDFSGDPVFLGTLAQPFQLYDIMGSFWRNYLADTTLLAYQEFAKLQNAGDVYLYSKGIEAAGSIQNITPYVARQWRLITLLQSELQGEPNVVRYGAGRTYGDGLVYGQLAANSFIWTIQEDIQEIGVLVDDILAPGTIFDLSNCSYDPTTNQLKFAVNPFTVLPMTPVYDGNGTLTDQSIQLFARNVSEDKNLPYLRYGAVVNVNGVNGPSYVASIQAVWSMLVRGPSMQALLQGMLASAGLPYCAGDETVQLIGTDTEGLAIVTDRNVYRFGANATPLVAVGDVLEQGQTLTDTIELVELGSGATPDFSAFVGLALNEQLCTTAGELVAPNIAGTWTWTGSDAQFTLYGNPADVAAFWATAAARGVAQGKTLAQCVGVSATSGPVPVNPMAFIFANLLGNNVILASMKPQDFLVYQQGFMGRVHDLLPAGTMLLVQIEIDVATDTISLASNTDTVFVYDAFTVPTEVIAPTGGNLTYTDLVPMVRIS